MEVFNKFYSSVSNTVSQLSGVLPGNPVTREFEATQLIATAGPGLLWKVYKGYKKSTKQEASIFVFEKKYFDDKWPKADKDIMLETLKRGVVQVTKLRHPQILTVQHSLEESRDSLAFATEPVFASLANVLGKTDNLHPVPEHLENYKLFEVEIKYGLMQVAEGLNFLHNDVKLLHRNICPESIIVNQQGAWKIFGFDHCLANQSPSGSGSYWPFVEYCQAMHHLTQPTLDYLAPEYILSATHSQASDIYSLGMLIYALHSTAHQTLSNVGNDFYKYKRFANEMRSLPQSRLHCVADGLKDYVKLMLNATPELRPDPHQFLKIPYFEDVGVKTLNYLDSLFQWDNLQKSQFYKGLPQIIQKMPHRVCIYRILPCLAKEFVNPPMVPFVLPNVLLIAENSSKEEYVKFILPILKPVMTIQDPIQILLIFMQKMELLLKLTPPEEVKTAILPMLYRALESDAQQIQELCLSVLPTFASLIDYPAMKNALLPRIKKLCMHTNYISVRVNCLLCLGKILEHLDKWLVLDEIIPFLPQIPSREPAVLMGILGIYKLALSHKKLGITKEIMATKVLPFLIPLCVENGLTLNQFNALISLIKQMVNTVETEHRIKLEQLNSIQNESKGLERTLAPETLVAAPAPAAGIEDMFSGLGLESFAVGEPRPDRPDPKPSVGVGPTAASLTLEEKQSHTEREWRGPGPGKQDGAMARHSTVPLVPAPDRATPALCDLGLRLALHQETARKFSQGNPSQLAQQPVKIPPPSIHHTPKTLDLTSSLLESNLTQLTKPPNRPLSSTVSSPTNMMSSVISMNNYPHQSSPMVALSSGANYNLNQNRPMGFAGNQLNMAASQWNANNANFNNKWANNQNNQSNMKQDWSAFESLLPTQNTESANNNVKKTSNNEMMDLLS